MDTKDTKVTEAPKDTKESLDTHVNTRAPAVPKKRKGPGRPRKTEVAPKRSVGRPKGTQAIINDYRDRMLASPKSRKVMDSIFDAALDPEHKNQAAAWKLVMDRIAPVAAFEKEILKGGNARNAIQINITGVGEANVVPSDPNDAEATEADWEPVDDQ